MRDSKLVRKEAILTRVTSRHTGEPHHDALTIKTTKKRQAGEIADDLHTVGLTTESGEDEIQRLLEFLQACKDGQIPDQGGRFAVVPVSSGANPAQIARLVRSFSAAGKAEVLADVLRRASHDPEVFATLLDRAGKEPDMFANAAAALNLARYRKAYAEMKALIEKPNVGESELQAHLEKNPWMFGSEYSELLDQRNWTRDEKPDFVLRRTTDAYIELTEIKTPLNGKPLFNLDISHDSHYAGAELSKVVGQVEKYLEELDRNRDHILAKDKEDTNKIRGRIVIGRDGDAKQREALRRYNGHFSRIEVMTFDHLLRIAERVIGYLERTVTGKEAPPQVVTATRPEQNGDIQF